MGASDSTGSRPSSDLSQSCSFCSLPHTLPLGLNGWCPGFFLLRFQNTKRYRHFWTSALDQTILCLVWTVVTATGGVFFLPTLFFRHSSSAPNSRMNLSSLKVKASPDTDPRGPPCLGPIISWQTHTYLSLLTHFSHFGFFLFHKYLSLLSPQVRVFASAWNLLLPHICITCFFTSFRPLLNCCHLSEAFADHPM